MAHWSVDWGDGTTYLLPRDRTAPTIGRCPPTSHVYASAGTYTITVQAREPDGSPYGGEFAIQGRATVTVVVTSLAPVMKMGPTGARYSFDQPFVLTGPPLSAGQLQ